MKRRAYWTADEEADLRDLYDRHRGRLLPLSEWAATHGRDTANVSRKARQLGLTEAGRPKKPPRKLRGSKWSTAEERLASIGRFTRERIATRGHPRGAAGLKHSAQAKERMAEASRKMWDRMTPERLEAARVKRNATNITRYGTAAPGFGRTDQPYSRCQGGKRPDLEDRYFRSAWEANYARYLNFLKAQGQIQGWEYEVDTFVFEGVTRGAVTYTPDFKVTDSDGTVTYHEVKGWMTSRAKMALRRMAKRYPEVTIRLVDEPVYRALSRQCRGLLANWE